MHDTKLEGRSDKDMTLKIVQIHFTASRAPSLAPSLARVLTADSP